jgi:hypothetical protein
MNTGAPNRGLSAYVIDNKHGLGKALRTYLRW